MIDGWSLSYVVSETIPNWIMAIAAAGAVIVFVWRKRDKAEQAALRVEERGDKIDAHWVAMPSGANDGKHRWGVLITNGFGSSLSNVEVSCSGNRRSGTLRISALAHGRHFVESSSGEHPWGLPELVANGADITPITSSTTHRVTQISFGALGRHYVRHADGRVELLTRPAG
ncbi:hypothetical protein GCM10010915_08320 [Microbacterium faecale]|uniref:Uncharacterized protein n=1 Tax=Microbacterium faecale TaxID=1804630 RepID=A0A916Y4K2_9MICO|nr:hypothetical protein [Microbacterium faecale]GGD30353.1 hypothetical protein GCM10010915_08320 [Microbacterium faecale]